MNEIEKLKQTKLNTSTAVIQNSVYAHMPIAINGQFVTRGLQLSSQCVTPGST